MTNPLALIIEDDEDLGIIFTGALQSAGFETKTVSDGQTALNYLAEAVPAVVILDLHLPHVSGPNVLQYIQNDDRLASTQIILATADALLADNLRAQATLVLLKPISFEQLSQLAKRLRPALS